MLRSAAVQEPSPDRAAGHDAVDWPLALVLDEIWLRTRRVLVHTLAGAGLWASGDAYWDYMRDQNELGRRLAREALRERLSEDVVAAIGAEAIFAASNRKFRRRMPVALAFGYTLGSELMLLPNDGRGQGRSLLCSFFNLGISVFDLVCDSDDELVAELGRAFDGASLTQLSADPKTATDVLRRRASGTASMEIRFLLALIAIFFEEARQTDTVSPQLSLLLDQAYRAEMDSLAAQQATLEERETAARLSSQLPFAIMAEIATIGSNDENGELITQLAGEFGGAFAVADDLIDLVPDMRAGALNTLLLSVGVLPGEKEFERDYQAAIQLLDQDLLDQAADRVRAKMEDAIALLSDERLDPQAAERLRTALVCYLRSWMG